MSILTIYNEALDIRGKLDGGSIFGVPIDTDNTDHLIVAAYYLAKQEELDRSVESWKRYGFNIKELIKDES